MKAKVLRPGLILSLIFMMIILSPNLMGQASGSKFGDDSATCVKNLSLYYEFFQQWKKSGYKSEAVNDAVGPWRWAFLNCPQGSKNIYLHGEAIIEKHLLKNAATKEDKDKYIDTLMMLYDNRIMYFGQRGFVLVKQGVDLYKYRPEDYEKVYNILKEGIALRGDKSTGSSLVYYFRAAEKMVLDGKEDVAILVDIFDQTMQIVENNLKSAEGDDIANWENVKGNLELSFEPYASCENLIGIYQKKFSETPEDVELLKKITKILDKKGCDDSELFFQATENLHELEPTPESAYLMGKMYLNKKKDYSTAINYLKEAADTYGSEDEKANTYFFLAYAYFQLQQYSMSRSYCYKNLEVEPNSGKTYILIGDCYSFSAADCGDNDLTKHVAYWAAVDKYYKAKAVDAEVTDIANSKINTYSRYFPGKETLFFHGLNVGDSYTVGCWINETTTVRSSD